MNATQGKVYLVGAGPGDPGLITVRGLDLIRRADVVVYDRLVNRRLLSSAPAQAEQVFAGKSPEGAAMDQEAINDLLVREARAGKMVVRLKGGDPFVFGRGGEEAQALARHGIEFEVVPGITSAIAVPAYAGIPVTHRDVSSSFTVITGHEDPSKELSNLDWGKIAGGAGTLIILMGISRLEATVQKLIEHGLAKDTPAVSTEWGTEYQQRTVEGDLGDIVQRARAAGLGAPAVTVVGAVVRLRDSLRWFDKKPLFGKRVLVTRARAQAGALSGLLEEAGAVVSEVPSIEIQDPEDWGPMDEAVARLADYSWVVFTSVNAVDSLFHRLGRAGMDARSMAGVRVCAIGPGDGLRAPGQRDPCRLRPGRVHHGEGGRGPGERPPRGLAGPAAPRRHRARGPGPGHRGAGGRGGPGGGLPDGRAEAVRAARPARPWLGAGSMSSPSPAPRPYGIFMRFWADDATRSAQQGHHGLHRSGDGSGPPRGWGFGSASWPRSTPSAAWCGPSSMGRPRTSMRWPRTGRREMAATFPAVRMRRLRKTEPIRRLVRETTLTPGDFVYPMFVVPGRGVREEIATMPGCFHVSADEAVREAEEALGLGVPGVMLFGLPSEKDAIGDRGLRQRRRGPGRRSGPQGRTAGAGRRYRRLPVRVHRPRPLRRDRRRRRGQRRRAWGSSRRRPSPMPRPGPISLPPRT